MIELMRTGEGLFALTWQEVLDLDLETFEFLRGKKEELIELQKKRR